MFMRPFICFSSPLNIVQKDWNRLNITLSALPVNKILEYRSNYSFFRNYLLYFPVQNRLSVVKELLDSPR